MRGYCFIDGTKTTTAEARIPVDDIGFLRSFAIYEGITTVGTSPVFLEDHLARLTASAALIGLSVPYTTEEMTDILCDLAAHVTTPRGDIRVLLTGGASSDGISPGTKGMFVAIVNDLEELPDKAFADGVSVMTHEHMRFLPQCKTTNYTAAVMLQKEKRERGATEIVYVSNDTVLEGSTSNIFIVKDGVLITPKTKILQGITRKKTIQIAAEHGIVVEEREISRAEMCAADEVFLTSSFKDILPVVRVDDGVIADGSVGAYTKRFIAAYKLLLMPQIQSTVGACPAVTEISS